MTAGNDRVVVVVTGMSGAGRTTALQVLGDLGFFCIDNLPTPLLGQAIALCREALHARVSVGMDVRVRGYLDDVPEALARVREGGDRVSVVFLDARDEALVRRYSETRRPHPLAAQFPDADLPTLIREEREHLGDLRALADRVIDTSHATVHDLRRVLTDHFAGVAGAAPSMVTRVVSFGFKHGLPVDADLVFDARFLPNPHFIPELRPRSGLDVSVASYVLDPSQPGGGAEFLGALVDLLVPLLPRYAREGKVVLTVGVGCTGGRHRSVAIAEALGARLRQSGAAPGDVKVAHRDIDRGG